LAYFCSFKNDPLQVTSTDYNFIKESGVHGRYLNLDMLKPLLLKWSKNFRVSELGRSVLGEPVYRVTLGSGPIRILMWSQMHGNESTTTKATLDLMSYLGSDGENASAILSACTLTILPMLNPDGARAYTRTNAGEIDLNRDARDLSQPESVALRKEFERLEPHFCFNLHDQRTIFSVGESPLPATVSFLAPAFDEMRSLSASRKDSMKLIAAINQNLQQHIQGQVGRYDDTFNPNCVGDTFQALNSPTVLFEAGHSPEDYQREQTRAHIFMALLRSLEVIASGEFKSYTVDGYFSIPENNKRFWDIIVRNPSALSRKWEEGISLGIQFKEVLRENTILFQPQIEEAGFLKEKLGHAVFDCNREADLKKIRGISELFELLK